MDRDSVPSSGATRRPEAVPILVGGAGGVGVTGAGSEKPESGSMANIAGHGDGRGSLLRKTSINSLMLRGRSKVGINSGGAGSFDGGHLFRATVAGPESEDTTGSGSGGAVGAGLVLARMQSALSTPSVFETILPRPRDGDGDCNDDEADDGAGGADDAIGGEEGELDSRERSADDRTELSLGTSLTSRRTSTISRAPTRNEDLDPAQAAVVEEKMLFSNAPVKRTRVEERIMHITCEIFAAFDPFLETYTGARTNPFTFEDPKRDTARTQPDIHELRLWCQSLSHLLRDAEGAAAFTEFLKQKAEQPALNALGFLAKAVEVSGASFDTHAHFVDTAAAVANDFLVDDAPCALPDEAMPAPQRRALAATIATAVSRCAAARAAGVSAIIGTTPAAGGRAGRPGSVAPGIRTGSGSGVFMPGMPLAGRRGSSGTASSGGSANSAGARVGARPLSALEPLDERGALPDTDVSLRPTGSVSESVDGVQSPSTSSGPKGGVLERDSMIAYVPLECDVFLQAILSVREGLAKGAYVRFLQSDTMKAHLDRVEVASTNDEDFKIAVAAKRKKK
ncbi:hypothetical protein HK405_006990 [Cladochytrium tenue]|nr:hypothetical protein HK405_006990 [Cladochytrium tenue]